MIMRKCLKSSSVITTITSLITITAISLIGGTQVMADDTVTSSTASVTVSSSCTMSSTIDTPHTANIANGVYQENIGKTTIKTFCNDANGYALYAVGYTGDTMTGDNHTKLIGSSTGTNISTGTYTAGTTTDSVWSMKLSSVTGTYAPTIASPYTNYSVIPSSFTKVASYNQGTDAINGTGSSIETTYAAYVSNTQSADTYTGKVKYVLVHPNSFTAGNYSVVYKPNGGTGTDVTISNIANYEPYTIAASTFTAPSGYQFAGWCTIQNNTQSPQTSCAGGTLYQPDDIATSLASAGGTFNLYATWSDVCAGYETMQGLTSSSIATMLPSTGSTATVCDARDGNKYTIAKLADNKVWMTTNLNIAGGTELSSTDTDFESTYTLPTTNGWTTNNGKLVLPASNKSGFGTDNYAYVYNTGNETSTCTSPGCYSYYSWDAATLGSGRSIAAENTDAPYSICPKGWRLPTSRTTSATNWQTESDFYALAHQYGLDSTTSTSESDNGFYTQAGPGTVPNFLLGGYYAGGSFYNGGSSGGYWSATSYSSSASARRLYFNSSYVSSANSDSRRRGFSVRCIFGE